MYDPISIQLYSHHRTTVRRAFVFFAHQVLLRRDLMPQNCMCFGEHTFGAVLLPTSLGQLCGSLLSSGHSLDGMNHLMSLCDGLWKIQNPVSPVRYIWSMRTRL